MERLMRWIEGKGALLLGGAASALVCVLFPEAVSMTLRITLGGAVMALILSPLAEKLRKKLPSALAAAICVIGLALLGAGILAAALPFFWKQATELMGRLGEAQASVSDLTERLNIWLLRKGWPEMRWEGIDWTQAASRLGTWLGQTVTQAGGAVRGIAEAGMMALLAFYMLRDMEALKLRLEWMLPRSIRGMGLRMASLIRTELGGYLRGQAMISLAVGALAAVGMWMAGTPGAGALGCVVGLLNLIPYFGPVLGGAPAVLLALEKGIWCVVKTLIVLVAVQQIDGYVISPRLMGQSTGLHPALVLLGIAVGGAAYGMLGMLFAVPFMLSIRSIVRIWSLRHEMV